MPLRPIGTPAEELADAEKLLRQRNINLFADLEVHRKAGKPELAYTRTTGPRPEHADMSGATTRVENYEVERDRLFRQLDTELAKLHEISRTENIEGRIGAQLARDAMAKRIKDVPREQAFERPNREFNADARRPDQFDKYRLEIEEEAELYDPPARTFREMRESQGRAQETPQRAFGERERSTEELAERDRKRAELAQQELERKRQRELDRSRER